MGGNRAGDGGGAAESFAVHLAAIVVPDEVDLAPTMVEAYLGGGRDRDELFRSARGPTVAGFGVGDALTVLPAVLAALASSAVAILPAMRNLLTPAGEALECTNHLFELRRKRKLDRDEVASRLERASPDEAPALLQVIDALEKGLAEQGVDEDNRNRLTLGCVKAFLSAPVPASQFVERLRDAPG